LVLGGKCVTNALRQRGRTRKWRCPRWEW